MGATRLFPMANGTLQQDSENHGLDRTIAEIWNGGSCRDLWTRRARERMSEERPGNVACARRGDEGWTST